MNHQLKILTICLLGVLLQIKAAGQTQSCPANINFSTGDLSFWSATTGLLGGGQISYPAPNNGVALIPEYTIGGDAIQVITSSFNDYYGGFPTIPTINGYAYNYSIKLGSTATSFDLHATVPNPGGFARSVSYVINVPAGSAAVPYTMTYAYAMVLENGTHNSNEQPLFKATLESSAGVITCASPQYYLPTFNNTGSNSTGATLDTAAALANGFSVSPKLFLSHAGQGGSGGVYLQDVWTKGWTEVTFDLSPYRGQQVTLTFEADNCHPGAHFAYAYVALRNTCAGLEISGPATACTNTNQTYSVPALAGATYNWTVPAGWTIVSGNGTNIITVQAGGFGGQIIAHEVNGCADLRDTLVVRTTAPTISGDVNNDNTVCSGNNSTTLTLSGERGNILNWISSSDGVTWAILGNVTSNTYTATNLTSTTHFAALVQNGPTCAVDTSLSAIVTVDPKSVGGQITPAAVNICAGQTQNNQLSLTGHTGSVVNWQSSPDNISWTGFIPAYTSTTYAASAVTSSIRYRAIIKSGVCPADTSAPAVITYYNTPFPQAAIDPPNASICYGKSAALNATITTGTSYTWSNSSTLSNTGTGTVSSLPYLINATATPVRSTNYVLTVSNAGCPNNFTDTFKVVVAPKIIVFAGNDTNIVSNQPLQLHATASDPAANNFTWSPGTGLSSTLIYNPVATLSMSIGETITYTVRATNSFGCYGEDDIKVTIFKTGPDIFIPGAFTPNGDGRNDVIRPICVGITQLNYFKVFNRWGQLVYSTSTIGQGWDGRIGGIPQASDNFVYMAQGVDYLGHTIFKKGTVMLIH